LATDGQFPVVMRGYARDEVDKTIANLRRGIIAATTERNELATELSRLGGKKGLGKGDLPTYSGLGTKLEMVLRTSEEQATVLISKADIQAQRVLADARIEADQIISDATSRAESLIAAAEEKARYETSAARIDAENITAIAVKDVETLQAEAIRETNRVRGNAATEAASARATLKREMSEKQALLNREIAEQRLVMDKEAQDARAEIARLIGEADRQKLDLIVEVSARRHELEQQLLEEHRDIIAQNEAYLEVANKEFTKLQNALTALKREHNRLEPEVRKIREMAIVESREAARSTIDAANAKARQIVNAARNEAKLELDNATQRLAEIAAERDAIASYIGDLNSAVAFAAKSLAPKNTAAKTTPKTTTTPKPTTTTITKSAPKTNPK
jgi:cell division septum initiation protein DivIVA